MDIPIEVNMKFICPHCNESIDHDYTQEDILKLDYLDLTCQKCGYNEKIQTSILIDKAKEKAIEEIQKAFNS